MPLSPSVINQRGKVLSVAADFGHGWREYDPQRQSKRMDTPSSFDFIAEQFLELRGEIVAVVGRVVQPGHTFDGLQLCALPVPYVEIDFHDNPGNYHLVLSPQPPCLIETQPPPHYDSVIGSGYPE